MAYIGSPAAPTIATVSDDTITTAKIADDAVTSAKINDGAVTPSDLSAGHPNWDASAPADSLVIDASGNIKVKDKIQFGIDPQTHIQAGSTNDVDLIVAADTNLRFETSTNERMRIDSSGNIGINNSNPNQYISSADKVLNVTGSAVNTSPATLAMNGSSTLLGRDFATTQVFAAIVTNTSTEITRITGTSSNGFRMMVRITTSGHTGGVGNGSIYAMYYWDGGTGTPQQIFRYDTGANPSLSFDTSTSNVFIIKLASAGAAGNYQGPFMVEWFVPQDFSGGTWTIS